MDTICANRGWPVALRRDIGNGTLVVTTLSLNAWQDESKFDEIAESLKGLAKDRIDVSELPLPVTPQKLAKPVESQIGYKIVGRNVVGALLGLFCLFVAGAGAWLAHAKRLELLAPTGAGAALAVAAAFVAVGEVQRGTTQATIAGEQYLQVLPGQPEILAVGSLGIYNPGEQAPSLQGNSPNPIFPDFSSDPGRVHRLVFHDLNSFWSWEGILCPVSGGVRTASFSEVLPPGRPTKATISFGNLGVVGHVDAGDLKNMRGAVLACQFRGCLPVHIDVADGTPRRNILRHQLSRQEPLPPDRCRKTPKPANSNSSTTSGPRPRPLRENQDFPRVKVINLPCYARGWSRVLIWA